MKINELITLCNEGKIENLKEALEIKDYVPFAEKYELCASVINACNEVDEVTGLVKVDSINKNITFTIAFLSMYTNLEFSTDVNDESTPANEADTADETNEMAAADETNKVDSIDEYDMLCRNKLLKPILKLIEEEYAECSDMLNTMQIDLISNNNTLPNVIGNVAAHVVDIIEMLANVFGDKMQSLNLDLSQDNIDKYISVFETLMKNKG